MPSPFRGQAGKAGAFVQNVDGRPINQAISGIKSRRIQMTKKAFLVLSMLVITSLIAGIPAVYAQKSPGDFTGEPDKTMAAGHESFAK
jgi:hypothetical protein